MKSRSILLFARFSLVCIFLVIIAGSVVRMTGSGMGCPDWPKCYGYTIPPGDPDALTYSAGRSFEKGQMVILNDTLWVANSSLIAGETFNRNEWHKYPKHDYAIFNPTHTWIEYINRLATVLLGIPVLILFVLSFVQLIRYKDFATFLWSGLALLMLGFEAWLGKVVVDGNLKENSITYHMLGSLALVAFIIMVIIRHSPKEINPGKTAQIRILWLMMLVLAFIQVMMGTQVREEVDIVARINPDRSTWIEQLPKVFLVHRSFSILVVVVAFFIYRKTKESSELSAQTKPLLIVLGLEILAGVGLSYFSMPSFLQPVHLFFGVVLFAICYYSIMTDRISAVR